MKSSLLLSILLMTSAAHAQLMCSDALKPSVTVAEFEALNGFSLRPYVNEFKMAIRLEVISGKETPTWQDFDAIKNFLVKVKSLKQRIKSNPETAHLFEGIAAELKDALVQETAFQKLLSMHQDVKQNKKTTYQPTERELKRAYQFYVLELNKVLPRELRLPLAHLQAENRAQTMNKEAGSYIKGVEQRFENLLKNLPSGSYEKFIENLRKSDDPDVQLAISMIEKNELQVVMRRPPNARFWVPKVGFQNQFITGSSRGSLSPDTRNYAEHNMYHQENLPAYRARDPEFKPKYGTLSVRPESAITPDLLSSAQYGSDIYGFKTEAIQERLTFYFNDSLYPGGVIETTSQNWDASFIPWKYRMLMVPFMVDSLRSKNFKVGEDILKYLPTKSTASFPNYYWETQVLGAVRLSDVETFTFTENKPPTGEFLRELIKHNITIYDGTAGLGPGQLKKWTPTPENLAAP